MFSSVWSFIESGRFLTEYQALAIEKDIPSSFVDVAGKEEVAYWLFRRANTKGAAVGFPLCLGISAWLSPTGSHFV